MLNESNLHEYQKVGVEKITTTPHAGLFLDMGLGKTVTTLTGIRKLIYEELDIDTALIVAPKRVAESVWSAEIDKWEHLQSLKISKIIGDQKKRKAALREKADIYIISRDNIAWLCGLYGGNMLPFDMLIVDESSSFKNPKSQRFKALKMVQPSFRRVCILTGTPAPNGLIDLWSQIYLLDRGERLGKTISAYREDYFKPGDRNGAVVYNYKIQNDGADRIHKRIGDICMSMKTEDYLELPPLIITDIELNFSDTLKKKYNEFERDQVLELFSAEEEITAANAAALSNKLLQFANGAVYDENRDYHEVHDLKLDALEELVESANGKPVLIAYTFKHDLERILKRLKGYGPRVLKTDQDIQEWNEGKIPVLVIHPASGGHGLNLQYGGNILIWFGQTWSLELYMQLNKRLHRQGNPADKVYMFRILVKSTIDEDVIKSLVNKDEKQEGLMQAVKVRIDKYHK